MTDHRDARAALLGALALLGLAGCTPIDTRELQLVVSPRPLDAPWVRFTATYGGRRSVEIRLDGRTLGPFETGRTHELQIGAEHEGRHRLEAVGDGPRPAGPARGDFEIFRGGPRLVATRPAPGIVPATDPFDLELDLSEPIDPGTFRPREVTVIGIPFTGPALPRPAELALLAGGRTLRIRVPGGLEPFEAVQLRGVLRGYGGHPLDLAEATQGARWSAASVRIGFGLEPGLPLPVSGVTRFRPFALLHTGPSPTTAELEVDGQPIGSTALGSESGLAWDSTGKPDGVYPLVVRVPGHLVAADQVAVRVDNSLPRVTCRPLRSAGPQLDRDECVLVSTSEDLPCVDPAIVSEEYFSLGCSPLAAGDQIVACPFTSGPPAPYAERLVLGPAGTDGAGNAPVLVGCDFTVAAVRSPWGGGPLSPGGSPIVADAFALAAAGAPPTSDERTLAVAWVPPVGAPSAGRLQAARRDGGAWLPVATLSGAGAIASSPAMGAGARFDAFTAFDARLAWVERSADGPGQIHSAIPSGAGWLEDVAPPLNRDPTHDAGEPAVGSVRGGSQPQGIIWSESDGAGGRAVEAFVQWDGGYRVGAEARAVAGSTASTPAVLRDSDLPQVAFLEDSGAGPAQLRATQAGFLVTGERVWAPAAGTLNADPARAAAAPTAAGGTVVAWEEGGLVWARLADGFLGFVGVPTVLNADPGEVARQPQAFSSYFDGVAFVEETPRGDEIRLQVRTLDGWHLVDGAVNTGVPGPVRGLRVSVNTGGVVVAWLDADGHVQARLASF